MSYIRGEDLNIGIGMEDPASRGSFVVPQVWIAGRTPTGINVEVIKALLKETKASGIMSRGSEIVQRRASGNLEFNLRSESIGYLLKSLLGKTTPTLVGGSVYSHLFEVLASDPQFPSLSLVLSQPGQQDYKYKGSLAKSLVINTPVDDLVNATVELISIDEEEVTDKVVAFAATDYKFRPYEVTIKIAANLAGLGAAEAIDVKEFNLNIENNSQALQHIGSITPSDNLSGLLEIGGSIMIDYQNDTYHDIFKDGTYKAIEITLERTDIDLGSGNTPKVVIQLARVSFEASNPDRPLDDILRDSFDFLAHYSESDSEAINIVVQNTIEDYNYDAVST